MTRIAFLGLGRMGSLMAARLLGAGHELTVWNRDAARAAPLEQAGAGTAVNPADAVSGVDLVVSMLTGPEAINEVFFGKSGAVEGLTNGTIVIEMSTIGPAAVADLRGRLPDRIRLLDAPVKGSLPAAKSGALGIFVGGSAADLEATRNVLDALGNVQHVGPLGAGASVKLLMNLVLGASFVMVGEALALADKLDVSTELALTVLQDTVIGPLIPRVRGRLSGAGPTQFSLGLAEKDLRLILAAGGQTVGVAAGAQFQLAAAVRDGWATNDISGVLGYLRGRNPRIDSSNEQP